MSYETDFYKWTQDTACRLRRGEFAAIDTAALAEEVESLGKRERHALESRLAVLLAHRLKWSHQPGKRSRSWAATITLQCGRIEKLLKTNPSLRPFLDEVLADAYQDGVLLAVRDTGLDAGAFPPACAWSVQELLEEPQEEAR